MKELFIWMSAAFKKHQQYCHMDTLEFNMPKLAEMVKRYPQLFWDGKYCYHLTRFGNVVRWRDFLPKFLDYEKHKPHNACRKLEEFNIK